MALPALAAALAALFAGCCLAATGALAAPSVRLAASLTPEHLGHGSTVGMSLHIRPSGAARTPPPVREIDLRYPNNLGVGLSGLGLETCTAPVLEMVGPDGCPPDSYMGRGRALAVVPFGPELIHESATVTILRGENEDGLFALLFDAQGLSPVKANIVLTARLLPTGLPYGGRLRIEIPLIPSLPEAPPVALSTLSATLGPEGLTYYEEVDGEPIPYSPKGIVLPDGCPRRGFPFAAGLTFQGGARVNARALVRCPAHHAARRPGGKP